MRIAFDSWVLASRFRNHGTYVYAQSLIAEFKKIVGTRNDLQFRLFASPNNSNDAGHVQPGERFEVAEESLLSHKHLWRFGGLSLAAVRSDAELIFAPAPSAVPIGKIPVICTIHDATPITMPSHSKKITLMQRSLLWALTKRAAAIITVSQCSKNDLVRIFGVPESRIFVVYNGYDKALFNDAPPDATWLKNLLTKLGLDRPYILHHGVIQPRKNLKRLIEAYRLVLSRNSNLDLDLVLAGTRGWNDEEILTAAEASGRGRVIFPGALSSPDLAVLIKGATLAVVPSLYEGFCLPMVESMACGIPVITANSSCLPEVSGGVLKYFGPCSIEDMAECMEQALEDEALRNRLTREGKKRAEVFDWQRCAAETVAVFENTVH